MERNRLQISILQNSVSAVLPVLATDRKIAAQKLTGAETVCVYRKMTFLSYEFVSLMENQGALKYQTPGF